MTRRVISVIFAIVGLIIVLKSTTWGLDTANSYLSENGGNMDTSKFLTIIESCAASYRLIGGILLGIGAYSLLRKE